MTNIYKSPYLSIVIVTWNNENQIQQAIASCLASISKNNEIELIIVNNNSQDRTKQLIYREIKGYEDKCTIINNTENLGLGEARNIGINICQGEYFIFLDGDDWIESNMLSPIIKKLRTHSPDILLYDYQRVYNNGYTARNQLSHLLYEHDASDNENKNKILEVFCIACNKAYRTDFIKREAIKFSDGYYEDTVWTYTSILKSEKIYTTPILLLNYRQRPGSILRSTDQKHLILPERYQEILRLLQEDNELKKLFGSTLYKLAESHLFAHTVWPRIPKNLRSAYLKSSYSVLEKWKKELKIRKNNLTSFIAKKGLANAYSLLITLKKNKLKIYHCHLFVYRYIFCHLPINKKRIYIESYWGDKLDCNPKAICEHLEKNPKLEVYFGIKRSVQPPITKNSKPIKIGTFYYWYIVATSKLLITNTNLRNEVIKRKNSIHLQTQHGTPLKTMGLDNINNQNIKMNWDHFSKRCSRWDYVISSNPYSSKIWRKSFPYDYTIIESGYPRNDILFKTTPEQINSLKESMGIPCNKKIILYAPTYRDVLHEQQDDHPILEQLISELDNDTILLVRQHHLSPTPLPSQPKYKNKYINVSHYDSINHLYLISDILITDYSSVMFDYACLLRPIILFHHDIELYKADRGLYFNINDTPPGIVISNLSDLVSVIKNKKYLNIQYKELLIKFNKEFCPWDDGTSTERILDQILK